MVITATSAHARRASEGAPPPAFDDMASEVSPLLWADMHREVVAGAAVGVAALAIGAARLASRAGR